MDRLFDSTTTKCAFHFGTTIMYNFWLCRKVCSALSFLDNIILIRFDPKLFRQIVDIQIGTNIFYFAIRETSCCLVLTIIRQSVQLYFKITRLLTKYYFEVGQLYLQLNKANSFNTETPFMNLDVSIAYGLVSSKIYHKRDDFDFEIITFPFQGVDVPCSTS